jgi:hypothetical protein
MLTMAILSVGFVHSPGRIALPVTAFGSVVSFLFVASNSVPVLPYSTRLDRFFLLCFYCSWFLFLFNVASFVFGDRINKFKTEAAKRRAAAAAAAAKKESTPDGATAPSDIAPNTAPPAPAPAVPKQATSTFGVGELIAFANFCLFDVHELVHHLCVCLLHLCVRPPNFLYCSVMSSPPDRYDVMFAIVLECAFMIGVCVILSGAA